MPLPQLDIFEKLRGLFTPVIDIRRRVLIEVARMIERGEKPRFVETIPYIIIEKNTPTYRESVFLERAIVRERVRLAFGLDTKEFGAHGPIIDDVKPAMTTDKVITAPLVQVIKIGCERCPEKSYRVSDGCMGCIAHPCVPVCPKEAVSIVDGYSFIDQAKCIKCGKCQQVCPYNAILYRERPCAAACGVNAITSDSEGFADIKPDVCVSCGLCVVSCPFGAIAEKSEIVQVLHALKSGKPVWAEIAPSFTGQFGPLATPEKIIQSLGSLGFSGVAEVAYGADLATVEEGARLAELVRSGNETDFVGTSCCPSWVMTARKFHPEFSSCIADSYTPMVETARKIKSADPGALVVFIGPCVSKKAECFDERVSKYVDYVITFEELAALFKSRDIDPAAVENGPASAIDVTSAGRSFPVAGNVARVILESMRENEGITEPVAAESADTLKDCLNLLKRMKTGQITPRPKLIEGMACPNGCIGGPGTLAAISRSKNQVTAFADKAAAKIPAHPPKKQS